MSNQDPLIFDVSSQNFDTSVILNSHKVPVLVEFMGAWSGPCLIMADKISRFANEFSGQFIFAKVDIDEQPELLKKYSIGNVPTLMVFKEGNVVRTEEGELQEDELRELLKVYGIYRESDELRQQARQKHMAGETVEAIKLLTQAIQQDSSNTRVAMDMVQIFLDIRELEQAKSLFERLPENDRLSEVGKSLQGQLTFIGLAEKTEGKDQLQLRIDNDKNDYDALFDLAVCYVSEHNYVDAMNQLFLIFENNPDYKEGAAREMIVSLSDVLAIKEPELSQKFRRRLGGVSH